MDYNTNKMMRHIGLFISLLTIVAFYMIVVYGVYKNSVFQIQSKNYTPEVGVYYEDYVILEERNNLSTEQKVKDFLFLSRMLTENTFLKEQTEEHLNFLWEERDASFLKEVKKTSNDIDFYFVLRRYLNELNSIHTYVMAPNYENYLSVSEARMMQRIEEIPENNVREFEEKLTSAVDDTLGYQEVVFVYIEGQYYEVGTENVLVQVNGNQDIYEEMKLLGVSYRTEYDHLRKTAYYPFVILNEGYGEKINVKMADGKERSLCFSSEVEYRVLNTGLKGMEKGRSTFLYLWEDDTVYLRIGSLERYRSAELKDVMDLLVEEERTVKNIIIDLRGNVGGISGNVLFGVLDKVYPTKIRSRREFYLPYTEWNKLLMEKTYGIDKGNARITKNVPDAVNDGKYYYAIKEESNVGSKKNEMSSIYVLVNNDTASAADWLAHDLREYMDAKIVGVNTNGEGLGESPAYTLLPNSGLLVSYFDSYAQNSDGRSNSMYGTAPDYYVENTIGDFNSKEYSEDSITQLMKNDSQLKYALEELIWME